MRKPILIVASGALVFGGAALAYAAASPAVGLAIKSRQANFKEIGGDFKAVNDEIKSGSPSFNVIRPATHDLAARAADQGKHFIQGSGPEAGVKTRALPLIWTDSAGFAQANANFVKAAAALDAAAQKGDLQALSSARNTLGGACKGCHDKYRARDED